MTKFKTPVAMKVTQEQYVKDLKKPLEELGRWCDKLWNDNFYQENGFNYLVLYDDGAYAFYSHEGDSTKHFIDHYNPELFLALAAMTEGEDWIVGEWLKYTDNFNDNFNDGEDTNAYKCLQTSGACLSISGLASNEEKRLYRKATAEELISQLSKEEFPKNWYCPYSNEEEFNLMKNHYGRNWFYIAPDGFRGCSNLVKENYWVFGKEDPIIKKLTKITFEQFKKHVLNQNKKPMKDSRFPFKLNLEQVKTINNEIIFGGCYWSEFVKTKLLPQFLEHNYAEVSEDDYNKARKDANEKQNTQLDEIFGKDTQEIDFDRITIGSKVMLKETGEICNGWKDVDFNKPFYVLLFKTPEGVNSNCKKVFKSEAYSSYCTFYQDGNTVLFPSDEEIDFITEVIEY